MSISMRTYGSALTLKPGTDEDLLTEVARSTLLHPSSDLRSGGGRGEADRDEIEAATTLEGLFAAFKQIVIRDESGQLVGSFGYDDTWYDPKALLSALAPDLVDGSWYAYKTDISEYVLYVHGGSLTVEHLEENTLKPGWVEEWPEYYPNVTPLPYAAGDSADVKLTALARKATQAPELIDGAVAPEVDDHQVKLGLLEKKQPYALRR